MNIDQIEEIAELCGIKCYNKTLTHICLRGINGHASIINTPL